MAKATKKEIPPVPVAPVVEVTLVLSKEEAETLLAVLGRVGGNPYTTRRKHTQDVYNALLGLKLDYNELGAADLSKEVSLTFYPTTNQIVKITDGLKF